MRRVLVCLTAATLVLGACAGDEERETTQTPKETLVAAFEDLSQSDGQSITFTLESTPESLRALGEGDISADLAEKILDSSLTVSGNNPEDPKDALAEIVVNVAGEDDVEMRTIGETLYVRADVRGLAQTFGAPQQAIDQAVQFGTQAGLDFIGPAVEGRWLAITGLQQLAQQFGGAAPSPTADVAAQRKAFQELTSAISEDATVTSEGEDDVGEHLVATLPIRRLYQHFLDFVQDLGAPLPPGAFPQATEVPNDKLSLDVWVADDTVAQMEFDFLQLGRVFDEPPPEGVDRLAFRLALAEFDGEVEVPDAAVPVDAQKVLQSFFGVAGSVTTSESKTVKIPAKKKN